MLAEKEILLTEEEYLSQERSSKIKSEFHNGKIFALAGASKKHNQILTNIIGRLYSQIIKTDCNIYSSDMKVKINKGYKYLYPDIVISCDKEIFQDDKEDILLNPIVIMEILSNSTEAYDRGEKFLHYQNIKSLKEYYLISQKNKVIERFIKKDDNNWDYSKFLLDDKDFLIISEFKISVENIYRKVDIQTVT